jgi:hypothetical protein
MSVETNLWPLVKELATALDGDREHSEETISRLESELRGVPRVARDEIRRQIVQIIAGLSRLEVRLVASDGPIHSAI